MKRIGIILFLVISFIGASAQETPIKVVFDVTSSDVKVHESTMRHVSAMSKNYPDSKFEVVVYSGALQMVLDGKSTVQPEIEKLVENEHVKVMVCQGTLRRMDANMSQVIDGVGSVPDGILEIVSKQSQGWAYIKEAN